MENIGKLASIGDLAALSIQILTRTKRSDDDRRLPFDAQLDVVFEPAQGWSIRGALGGSESADLPPGDVAALPTGRSGLPFGRPGGEPLITGTSPAGHTGLMPTATWLPPVRRPPGRPGAGLTIPRGGGLMAGRLMHFT